MRELLTDREIHITELQVTQRIEHQPLLIERINPMLIVEGKMFLINHLRTLIELLVLHINLLLTRVDRHIVDLLQVMDPVPELLEAAIKDRRVLAVAEPNHQKVLQDHHLAEFRHLLQVRLDHHRAQEVHLVIQDLQVVLRVADLLAVVDQVALLAVQEEDN